MDRQYISGINLVLITAVLACTRADVSAAPPAVTSRLGTIEYETTSKFSRIRIRKSGTVLSLIFVRDSGLEVIETQADLSAPHKLLVPYTRTMFATYLFHPKQKRVLIVGLGGGAMVRFLRKYDPDVRIDVVEIDPVIVKIADKYFGVRTENKTTIHTADGFHFLAKTTQKYDAIYMDAFLKPTRKTDATGVPLQLKTRRFYKSLHAKLTPQGVVAFNLNKHKAVGRDVAVIRRSFPQTYEFRVRGTEELVVIASMHPKRPRTRNLQKSAAKLDARFKADFSLRRILKDRSR